MLSPVLSKTVEERYSQRFVSLTSHRVTLISDCADPEPDPDPDPDLGGPHPDPDTDAGEVELILDLKCSSFLSMSSILEMSRMELLLFTLSQMPFAIITSLFFWC